MPLRAPSATTVLLAVVFALGSLAVHGVPVPAVSARCPKGTHPLVLDLEHSVVRWRGTKLWGRGEHRGIVRFRGGVLCLAGSELRAGWLEVDMRTIEVTDIPARDPIPRRRLREHLQSEDFFHVTAHPTAGLVLRRAARRAAQSYRVSGELTIRGHSRPVTFLAHASEMSSDVVRARARLAVERHAHGVSYRGSRLRDDLVDDTFWLDVLIEARSEMPTRISPLSRP